MGTIGSYYLNGPNLVTSTGIFTDIEFTTCAPNGYYAQSGIVRQLQNCILLPREICPSCSTPCGGSTIEGPSEIRMYIVPIELGSVIGAVKITFNPVNVPEGIRGIYNNTVYNEFSSAVDGYHQTTVQNGLTYMGNTANLGTLISSSPHTVSEASYYNGSFADNGNTTTVDVSSVSLTTSATPGDCIAYIPKTSNSPTTLSVEVAELLATGAAISWYLDVGCPVSLTSLPCTAVNPLDDCNTAEPLDETIFLGKVSGSINSPVVNDWAFEDAYSVTKKPSGDYVVQDPTPAKWLVSVGVNGVITNVTSCP